MLLWADGFDHYGTSTALMRNAAYAEVNNCTLVSDAASVRTGTRALRLSSIAGRFRRVFGGQKPAVGVAVAFTLNNLPSGEMDWMHFRDSGGSTNVRLNINSAGEVVARVGFLSTAPEVGRSGVCIGANSYQHMEAKAAIDNSSGAIEVRVNGVTVLNLAGIDTQSTAEASASSVRFDANGVGAVVDDFYAWDEEGYVNNDFIGDKKVYTRFPDADTTQEDWSLSTGADTYAILAQNPPVDASHYLYSEGPGDRSDVEVAALPAEIVSIAGVYVPSRMWKTDAGNSKVRIGMVSAGAEEFGDPHALSMAPAYYGDVFETDPNTGALWTLSDLNLAQLAVERTE